MTTFRPEFFNRIDTVVTFQPLSRATIAALAERELTAIRRRDGFTKAGLSLTWSDEVIEQLAAVGYDNRYGARPLQRAVEKLVIAPLAAWILEHSSARDVRLHLDVHGQRIRVINT